MPQIIKEPTRIQAHGQPPKTIEEFIGRANSQTDAVSIARMISPAGWNEPGQTPDFDEFTVVLRGQLQVETRDGTHLLDAGQAVIVRRGEWVRYSTPSAGGAEYIAVCLPAFLPRAVHRDPHEIAKAYEPHHPPRMQMIFGCLLLALASPSAAAGEESMSNVPNPLGAQLVRFSTMLTVRDLAASEAYYVRYFGFRVTERLEGLRLLERPGVRATHEALAKLGLKFLAPPQQPAWGSWRCFVQDPDGYLIEIEQP